MPHAVTTVQSTLTVAEIARIFESALAGRRVEFTQLGDNGDPFAKFSRQPDFSVVAAHDKNIGSWAVQLYVFDEGGDQRIAELHAVYHSLLERAIGGTRNTYSKTAGERHAQTVLAALRTADRNLTVG